MKYKDHETKNLDTALAERIQECSMSYPRPKSKMNRSEERRVGKECRYRWSPEH